MQERQEVRDLDLKKEIQELLSEEIAKLPEEERSIIEDYIEETTGCVESLKNILFDAENSKESIVNTIEGLHKLLEVEDVERDAKNISKERSGSGRG
jgi:DNA integrity scanning protein DisA with diadenylate cyclase activity